MIVVQVAYKNNLSFRTLWIEIQFAKKTIACATDKTKPLLSPTVKKEQLPICQSGWRKLEVRKWRFNCHLKPTAFKKN